MSFSISCYLKQDQSTDCDLNCLSCWRIYRSTQGCEVPLYALVVPSAKRKFHRYTDIELPSFIDLLLMEIYYPFWRL